MDETNLHEPERSQDDTHQNLDQRYRNIRSHDDRPAVAQPKNPHISRVIYGKLAYMSCYPRYYGILEVSMNVLLP